MEVDALDEAMLKILGAETAAIDFGAHAARHTGTCVPNSTGKCSSLCSVMCCWSESFNTITARSDEEVLDANCAAPP